MRRAWYTRESGRGPTLAPNRSGGLDGSILLSLALESVPRLLVGRGGGGG